MSPLLHQQTIFSAKITVACSIVYVISRPAPGPRDSLSSLDWMPRYVTSRLPTVVVALSLRL